MTLRAYAVPAAWPFPGRSEPAAKPKRARPARIYHQRTEDRIMNEAWEAWIDGAENDAVPFTVATGEDVIEAAASALGGVSRDIINVRRA